MPIIRYSHALSFLLIIEPLQEIPGSLGTHASVPLLPVFIVRIFIS